MLFLAFELGKNRYAIEAHRVVEVLPYLPVKGVPDAPKGFAGLINYRGRPVPVVDLSELALGTPARDQLSTRIIVVQSPRVTASEFDAGAGGKGDGPRLLGMIAENATELLRKEPREFVNTGMPADTQSSYGPVVMDSGGPIQLIREDRLLTDSIRALL